MHSIIGAGIAGLSCSISLTEKNIDHEIFDKYSKNSPKAYGIQISPNASNILRKLGVLEKIFPQMHKIETIELISARDEKTLTCLPIGKFARERYHSDYYTINRNTLHESLRNLAEENKTVINYNSEITSTCVTEENTSISINKNTTHHTNTVILSSGINSESLYPATQKILRKKLKFRAFRATLNKNEIPLNLEMNKVNVWLGDTMHLVVYPIDVNVFNFVLIAKEKYFNKVNKTIDGGNLPGNISKKINELISSIKWESWSLNESCTIQKNNFNLPIFSIGDSAHPMPPHLAQGAGMALEDGYVLAEILASKRTTEEMHQEYYKKRFSRVNKVIRNANMNGGIFHLNGVLEHIRNMYLKNLSGDFHLSKYDWLYNYKV